MNRTLKLMLTLLLTLTLVPAAALAQGAAATDGSPDATPAPTNAQGMPYMLNVFDAATLDLSAYQGKALFLNYFTGWCQYCMQEMPEIRKVYETYDPDQVAVILIHVWDGETADDSAAVVQKYGLENLTLVEDTDQTLAQTIGLPGYPTSLFIGKDGYLYKGIPSALDYDTMAGYLDAMGVAKRDETAGVAQ